MCEELPRHWLILPAIMRTGFAEEPVERLVGEGTIGRPGVRKGPEINNLVHLLSPFGGAWFSFAPQSQGEDGPGGASIELAKMW